MIAMMIARANLRRLLPIITLFASLIVASAVPGQRWIDSLSFDKADLPMVFKALAEYSHANIVIGPEVKGQITLTLRNVSVDEAMQLITSMSGLEYRVVNGTYVVNTPEGIAKQGQAKQDYLTVDLQLLSPEDAIAALAGSFKDITVKPLANRRLVLSGDKSRLQAAQNFLNSIDGKVTSLNQSMETTEVLYKVKSLVPWQAKQYLEDHFRSAGISVSYAPRFAWDTASESTPPSGTGAGTSGSAPTWVSNQLIIQGPRSAVAKAEELMAKIDVELPLLEKRCSVEKILPTQAIAYLLQRYDSRGLAVITAPMTNMEMIVKKADITGMTGGSGGAGQIGTVVQRDQTGKLNVSEPLGDFILRGPEEVVNAAISDLALIDVGPERVAVTYNLRFLSVDDAKRALTEVYADKGLLVTEAPFLRGGNMSSTAITSVTSSSSGSSGSSGSSNSMTSIPISALILRGPDTVVKQATATLDSLDIEPAQISISAEFINLQSSEVTDLGVIWAGQTQNGPTPGTTTVNVNEIPNFSFPAGGTPTLVNPPLKFGTVDRSPFALSAIINALTTKNKAKVISRPATVVQNGCYAEIHVGDKDFYERVTGYSTNGSPIYSIDSIDTGVTLVVRPLMSRDGAITLDISTQVASPPTYHKGSSGADLPSINSTDTTTTVPALRDGETVVIGGLTQNTQNDVVTAVPILSKIPLIGAFFRDKKTTPNSMTDLLILVTPRVLHNPCVNPADLEKVAPLTH